jgi:ElaB/YqjD/DUF883 family membrane-anchored ribosome-binding protein
MNEMNNDAAEAVQSSDEICTAADALSRAKAEFEKARAFYDDIRRQATERVKAARETSVGDMIDGTLEAVRRHPGASLTLAAAVGFYLGRLLRR